ncbi:hypothetical protein BGW38_005396 [Lunasporangiospora selenospora]|uniref:CotH protein n=1 Tax=Lunasporangiospora selenospora TaxID=979761 RepID=A0A9P6G012_9FUNG|nr:hypothetical protein BGW38_005396 [Lunasporangiospora selenospora]
MLTLTPNESPFLSLLVTFNVIGYPSSDLGSFGVNVNGQVTKLNSENTFPVWTGTVPGTTSASEYSYVELSQSGAAVKGEEFVRKLKDPKDTATPNEFFERQVTVWEDLPKVPYTYLATYPSKTNAFKTKQIATIHLTAAPASIEEMMKNPTNGKDYKVDFRFINSNTIHSQICGIEEYDVVQYSVLFVNGLFGLGDLENVTFKTSGKSSKEHSKQAFKFKFDTKANQTFFHRPNIKLRSMVMDPTMLREKLYIDTLNSAGVPTQQGAWVRLFVNNEPYGLFLMVDDIKKSFLKQTVHSGDDKVERGSLVKMNGWMDDIRNFKADLVYKGPATADYDKTCYKSEYLGKNPKAEPLQDLIALMKGLQEFDPATTPDPVAYWNDRLDLDGFLRNMALEYLGGAWDNYWWSASNYFMYNNPTLKPNGKWQWIPTDFDGTFGNGAPKSKLDTYKNWYDFKSGDHPLVSKLILQNKDINQKFETILKEIVSTVFKPEALFPRIEYYNKMLSEDAKWDISLKRKSPGKNNGYTFDDFNNNLDKHTKDMSYSVRGWVKDMADLVAAELKFEIPAGTADRVAPPPKKGDQGSPDGTDKDGDHPKQKGNKSAASAVMPRGAGVFVSALVALFASLIVV